ncbi:MAG: SAM-dependent methyltransferase, partial [Aestuariivirga sp.]
MYALLDRVFAMVVKTGTLRVKAPTGKTYSYGDGTGTPVSIRIASEAAARRIAIDADLALGETYMDGTLKIEEGTVYDMIALIMRNAGNVSDYPPAARLLYKLRKAFKRIDQYNPMGKAKANVAHHYDLSGQLYDLFLDRDRQYSCAYFETAGASLEEAQLAKKRHLAAKLDIKPGMKILDIGSGWGGLGLYLAEICGADIIGVTLSEEQHQLSNERAAQRGVAHKAQFRLIDYRALEGKFDRIVSVGMFEHVGINHYKEFFGKCRALLK